MPVVSTEENLYFLPVNWCSNPFPCIPKASKGKTLIKDFLFALM
jgi:hypothetical protein